MTLLSTVLFSAYTLNILQNHYKTRIDSRQTLILIVTTTLNLTLILNPNSWVNYVCFLEFRPIKLSVF